MRTTKIIFFAAVSALAMATAAYAGDNDVVGLQTVNGGIKDSFNTYDNSVQDNRTYDNRIDLSSHDNRITNNDNRDYSQHNTANGGAGGTGVGVGVGVGLGGAGGSVGNVTTGPATAINNAGDVDVRNTNDIRNTANGGSVFGSGNSANDIRNANTQGQGQDQDQKQQQGQLQGQQQQVRDSGNSSSYSNVSGSGNSTVDVDGNNAQLTNNAGDVNVKVEGDTVTYEAAKIPVSSAYAAPSVVGGGVCAYTPFSAGVQFLKFGGSAQGAIIDQGCEDRANADVLARLGLRQEAVALLAMNARVAKAMDSVAKANASKTYSGNTFQAPMESNSVATNSSNTPTVAVQDQQVGAIVAQGFIDPKKGYRILRADAKPE